MPYEGSKYHHPDIFEELSLDICNIKSKYDSIPLMLIGDFNSRTGLLSDIMIQDQNDPMDEYNCNFDHPNIISILNSSNIPINRNNEDKKFINNNGRKLIEMCKCHELCIANGRIGADKGIGHKTCGNKSTIDYLICTPDIFPAM